MLVLSFCGICHIMGNKIMADANLRLGHFKRFIKVKWFFHQSSCLTDLRFPANPTLKWEFCKASVCVDLYIALDLCVLLLGLVWVRKSKTICMLYTLN